MTNEKKRSRVNIYDVAKAAGVSSATVSRVINGDSRVAADIAARVLRAKSELGYVPVRAAQNLSRGHSRLLATVVPTLNHSIYSRKVEALRTRASELGYGLLIAMSNRSLDEEYRQCVDLIQSGVEGIMLEGGQHAPGLFDELERHNICYVNTSVYDPKGMHPTIGFSNEEIGARAVSHLVDIGHRRIGFIASQLDQNDRQLGRVVGAKTAALQRGAAIADAHIIECGNAVGDARQALRYVMAMPNRPSAVICGNDALALGAFLETQYAGLLVPDDLSLVGCDDLDFAAHLKPGLTTFYVPTAEIGARSADYLVARIEGRSVPNHQELDVPMILRGSTAPHVDISNSGDSK